MMGSDGSGNLEMLKLISRYWHRFYQKICTSFLIRKDVILILPSIDLVGGILTFRIAAHV